MKFFYVNILKVAFHIGEPAVPAIVKGEIIVCGQLIAYKRENALGAIGAIRAK